MTACDSFCVLPWIHLHVWPDGRAFSCCAMSEKALGNVNHAPLSEIWNSTRQRELRLNLLNGKPDPMCHRCHEAESAGGGSLRKFANARFGEDRQQALASTAPDGSVEKLSMRYLDIRFSNLCNFRCRTCGPDLSSSWQRELASASGTIGRVLRVPEHLWGNIESLLPEIEEIYFAGGEPLLMDEHWRLINMLAEKRLFHVRLRYSTNFSNMSYRGRDVMELWDRFENVEVWASLDASHARGEYLRKGQDWSQVIRNRERLSKACPRVSFSVQATLSLMNCLHLPDFHRDWVGSGYVLARSFRINPLFEPTHYRLQVLPAGYKEAVRRRYQEHIEGFLASFGPDCESNIDEYRAAIHMMDSEDSSHLLPSFIERVRQLDRLRGESFRETFPELAGLLLC